jgi:hypothetical protein
MIQGVAKGDTHAELLKLAVRNIVKAAEAAGRERQAGHSAIVETVPRLDRGGPWSELLLSRSHRPGGEQSMVGSLRNR